MIQEQDGCSRIILKEIGLHVRTLENVERYSCRVYVIHSFKLDSNKQGIYAVYTL